LPIQTSPISYWPAGDANKKIVVDGEAFEAMLRHLRSGPVLTVDYETSGLAWYAHARSCGVALATCDPRSGQIWNYYVPYRHETAEPQLDFAVVSPAIGELLADERLIKVCHNIKFEDHFSRKEGWRLGGPRYDTMLAGHLYDENMALGLEARAEHVLGHRDSRYWDHQMQREVLRLARAHRMGIGEYKTRFGYSQTPINLCGTYACYDTQYTTELYLTYERWGVSRRYPRLWSTEMELAECLCDMEEEGLPLDIEYLENLRDSLGGVKAGLEDQIRSVLGSDMFALGSDDELRHYLTKTMHLPLWKKTRKGQLSVDKEALDEFQDRAPVLRLLLEWREADKLENTYTTSLLEKVDHAGVIHPDFQQVGTNTGRLSCRMPNFQNQPTDNDRRAKAHSGKKVKDGGVDPWSIRRAFVVRRDGARVIPRLFFDYSQIELRTMAFYSRDVTMTNVYLTGGDIHDEVSKEVGCDRRTAKAINFGLNYCLTSVGLSRQAGLTPEEAESFMDRFFKRFPGVPRLREELWAQMRADPQCSFTNLFGRTRRIPMLQSPQSWEQGRAERQAIGSLIQGTAAELTKESIVRVSKFLKENKLPAKLVNTVHDEIQLDCEPECLAVVVLGVKRLMEAYPEFQPIPVVVDGEYTMKSWADKQALPMG
jgi:DNA polymerase I